MGDVDLLLDSFDVVFSQIYNQTCRGTMNMKNKRSLFLCCGYQRGTDYQQTQLFTNYVLRIV